MKIEQIITNSDSSLLHNNSLLFFKHLLLEKVTDILVGGQQTGCGWKGSHDARWEALVEACNAVVAVHTLCHFSHGTSLSHDLNPRLDHVQRKDAHPESDSGHGTTH